MKKTNAELIKENNKLKQLLKEAVDVAESIRDDLCEDGRKLYEKICEEIGHKVTTSIIINGSVDIPFSFQEKNNFDPALLKILYKDQKYPLDVEDYYFE